MICDNCGRSLDRGNEHFSMECMIQHLPPGETFDGRHYIRVCSGGECLDPDRGERR